MTDMIPYSMEWQHWASIENMRNQQRYQQVNKRYTDNQFAMLLGLGLASILGYVVGD